MLVLKNEDNSYKPTYSSMHDCFYCTLMKSRRVLFAKFSITSESQAPEGGNSWKNLYFSTETPKLMADSSGSSSSSASKRYEQYSF